MIKAPAESGRGAVSVSAAVGAAADARVAASLCAGGHEGAPERLWSIHGLNHGAANARHMPM
jgi:hypothetical protein